MSRYFTAVLLLIISSSALAADSVASGLAQCARIQSGVERLDCFDALADAVKAEEDTGRATAAQKPRPTERSVPQVAAPAAEPTQQPTPEEKSTGFGFDLFGKNKPEAEVPSEIRSRIVSAKRNSLGIYIIELENGMVWQEREKGRRHIDAGQDVIVTERRWSMSMLLVDQNWRVTVQRID